MIENALTIALSYRSCRRTGTQQGRKGDQDFGIYGAGLMEFNCIVQARSLVSRMTFGNDLQG